MLCCNNIVRRLVNCQPPELQCVSTWSFPKGLGTLPLSHDQLHLLGDPLQRVEYYKYLGLLISNNVSWLMHITATCSKVKQILGLLYRHFYGSASPDTLQLYLSIVRSHLDYACQIWDLTLLKTEKKLEDVQKFACRLASHQWDSSYHDLLQLHELPSLEERRLYLKLGWMFKIIHNLCYYPDIPSFRENIHRRAACIPIQSTFCQY